MNLFSYGVIVTGENFYDCEKEYFISAPSFKLFLRVFSF